MPRMYSSVLNQKLNEQPDGTVKNNAGGFSYALDKWKRLDQFLILGSEGGTHYLTERKLTLQNVKNLQACIQEDGVRVVNRIAEISEAGRAIKNDPAIFALLLCTKSSNLATRQAAYQAFTRILRIPTHLFTFMEMAKDLKYGRSNGLRKAVGRFYNSYDTPKDLAYHLIKYQSRNGWSHEDVIRLMHPTPKDGDFNNLFRFALEKWVPTNDSEYGKFLVGATEALRSTDSARVVQLIDSHNLSWEMVNTELLNDAKVLGKLAERMPVTASLRNLNRFVKTGLLVPFSETSKILTERFSNPEIIAKSKVHPLQVLVAMKMNSNLPPNVKDALDEAFSLSFSNAPVTNKKMYVAVDVSGSMSNPIPIGRNPVQYGQGISVREAAAAIALTVAKREPNYYIAGFSSGMVELGITKKDTIDTATRKADRSFDSTRISVPIADAGNRKMKVDAFVIITDNEVNMNPHPTPVLRAYRKDFNPETKLIVIGMTSNGFSVADPNDSRALDIVGFDTNMHSIISEFVGM